MSKAHKTDPARPANQPGKFEKSRDAKNGLHISNHCDKTLCDWSSPCKHIQEKRRPVLLALPPGPRDTHAMGAGDTAPQQLSPTEEPLVPYSQRGYVQAALDRYGDNAAFHLPDRQALPSHCAICHQWVTDRSKMKQHHRLLHQHIRNTSRFNSPGSPCPHCQAITKAPRQHLSKCTVLSQLCMLHLSRLRNGHGELQRCRMFLAPS